MILLLLLPHVVDASAIYLLMMELCVSVSCTRHTHSLRIRVGLCHQHTPMPSTQELNIYLTELNSWFLLTYCLLTKQAFLFCPSAMHGSTCFITVLSAMGIIIFVVSICIYLITSEAESFPHMFFNYLSLL